MTRPLPQGRGPFVEVGLGEAPDPVADGGAAEGGEEEELEAEPGEFTVLPEAEENDADTDHGEDGSDEAADIEFEVFQQAEHAVQFRGNASGGLTKGPSHRRTPVSPLGRLNPADKLPIVLRCVDPNCRLIDDADEKALAGVKDAELLEILDCLNSGTGQLGQAEEKFTAVGVETNVLMEMRRIGCQQRVIPVAGEGNGGAAEINGPLPLIEDDFDAGRIVELLLRANWRGERYHHGCRVTFQQLHSEINRCRGNLRFVTLDVDEDVHVRQLAGDFGDAVGAAGTIGARQFNAPAKAATRKRKTDSTDDGAL